MTPDALESIPYTKRAELAIEWVVLASRWMLVLFYLGLAIALGLYAMTFFHKLWEFALHVFEADEADAILNILSLIDAALRAHGIALAQPQVAPLCQMQETRREEMG